VPLSALNARSDFTIAEHPPAKPEERPGAQQRWIGPHYFRTMGIPLRAGRDIAESDRADTQLVAVIDEVLARQFWSGDPIGDHLELDDSAGRRVYEIVAVAASVRHFTLDEQPLGTLYMPYTQIMPDVRSFFAASASLVVRTKITPLTLVSRVRTELRAIDANVPTSEVRSGDAIVAAALGPRRFALSMLALFAGMSLVLALTCLHALAAHRVAQRRHELALRAAVGASPMRLMVDVISEASHLVAVAILLSAIGTVASGPLLQGLIVGIPALETRTFAWTTVLVASVTLAATMLAARRVLRVDFRALM
jgi:hypothetical protein